MTLMILDPDMIDASGATATEALAIAREAASRGVMVTILAARDHAGAAPEGVRVVPFFTHRSDATLHDDPVTGRFDDFSRLNDALAEDLANLPRGETRAADAVFVPRATVNQVIGYASWMKGFSTLDAPQFFLRFASPIGMAAKGQATDPLGALFFRLGLRALEQRGPEIVLGTSGRALAQEYSVLAGRAVAAMPLPICPEPAALPARRTRRAAIVAADAEPLLRALTATHPQWEFFALGAAESLPRDADLLLVQPTPGAEPMPILWEALALGVPMLLPQTSWMAREAALWGEFLGGFPATASTEQLTRHFAGAANRLDELRGRAAEIALRFRAENGAGALMDRIGGVWAARLAATMLLVRERETMIDLAALRMEGWHKLEEQDGQPVRWTDRAPDIAFDWPFLVPWQLRLRVRAHHGDDQLRGIEAWCGEHRLEAAFVHDTDGKIIRIEGRAGDPLNPMVTLRILLPSTHRPRDDPRDLGMLVSAITLRAAGAVAAARDATLPAVSVRAAADADGAWKLRDALSGDIAADAREPVALALRFDVPGGPAVARAIACFVNGVPIRLDLTPAGGTRWSALAALPQAVLQRGGLVSAWDLTAPEELRLLEIRVVRLAGMQRPAPAGGDAKDQAAEPGGAARRSKWWRGG